MPARLRTGIQKAFQPIGRAAPVKDASHVQTDRYCQDDSDPHDEQRQQPHEPSSFRGSEPLRPQQGHDQVNEQEQRRRHGKPEQKHNALLQTRSQAHTNAAIKPSVARPSKKKPINVGNSVIGCFSILLRKKASGGL